MREIERLLQRAKAVLEPGLEHEVLERLNSYTEAFDAWAEAQLTGGGEVEAEVRESVRALHELHALVLKRAEALKRELTNNMSTLKRKGRGLLAYTDILPKRVGRMLPKKF